MARPLDSVTTGGEVERQDRRAARATARAFAAAISALLVSTLVIERSSAALEPDGTVTGSSVASGTVLLDDDDGGRSLFDLQNLAPGDPNVQCIELTYGGTLLPAALTVEALATGDLGPYLDVAIDVGRGGGYDDCAGFVADGTLFTGTLADLVDAGRIATGEALNTGDRFTYRFTFALQDDGDALGRTATLDIVWEAAP